MEQYDRDREALTQAYEVAMGLKAFGRAADIPLEVFGTALSILVNDLLHYCADGDRATFDEGVETFMHHVTFNPDYGEE